MSPLNDPLWMNVEGASLVHQAGDVGHRDILGVAKAGVKERGAKQRVGHRVERRLKAFISVFDQGDNFRILVIDLSRLVT